MAKIYLARHQAGGFLTEFPFAAHPSAEQLAALERICFQRYGATHPKTKESYWVKVAELDVLGDEVPEVPEHSLSVVSTAEVGKVSVSAIGHVASPKK